jgi:hypothetical protein
MNKEQIYKDELIKCKAILDMVERWLDSNIDEPELMDSLQEDSANLKEKIQLARDPKTTVKEIESGNI